MDNEIRELNDDELKAVAGGTGGLLAKILDTILDVTSNSHKGADKAAAQWDAIIRS